MTLALATELPRGELLWQFLTAHYDFVLWCALGSVLVGLCAGLLGTFLVLRRMSLIGDTMSHATLPGIVIAFMIVQDKLLIPLLIGALIAGVLAAVAFGFIVRNSRTRPDAALGLVLTAFFGLGIVLLSYVQNHESGNQSGLNDFLFGNAIAIRPAEVALLAVLACICIAAVTIFFRPFLLLSFDASYARSIGFNTSAAHYGLMVLTSLVIVASIQSVGVVLVVAMLITPASTAYLLTHRLKTMLVLSGLFGMLSGYLGALISYLYAGFSSGPTMVLVASFFFLLAAAFSPRQGWVVRAVRQRRRGLERREALVLALLPTLSPPTLEALADAMGEPVQRTRRLLQGLERRGVLRVGEDGRIAVLESTTSHARAQARAST